MNILNNAEKGEKVQESVEKVDSLGKLRCKCPKCGHEFEKKQE